MVSGKPQAFYPTAVCCRYVRTGSMLSDESIKQLITLGEVSRQRSSNIGCIAGIIC